MPTQSQKQGRPRKRAAWFVSAGATIAVVAVGAFVVPPLLAGEPDTVEPTVTQAAPTATPARSYTAVTNFYKQAGPPAGSPLTAVAPQTVTVSSAMVGTKTSPTQVGIWLESTDWADPLLNGDNASVVATFKGLGKPMLRFGGKSVDRSFF
ncbi:hypothetical protein [Specibacter sp. NPDC078692]|uniref:hypothetical protein n=1 Tax=Specibacter sp. NPDC078692 TaxID=3155818 RepID=UPI00343054DE